MAQAYMDIEHRQLAEAMRRRQVCLESNSFRCNKCGDHRHRQYLVTVPFHDKCYCIDCWVSDAEIRKHKNPHV